MNETWKAYNTNTGKFYRIEDGCFSAECQHDGTTLDAGQRAVVRATFYHVEFVTARNGVEWPECGCDKCSPSKKYALYGQTFQRKSTTDLPPLRVGCYLPAGEINYVLTVIANDGCALSFAHRKGEAGYDSLVEVLKSHPELFTPLYSNPITLEKLLAS